VTTFNYLGRKYNVDKAWELIRQGQAKLIELDGDQRRAIGKLQPPTSFPEDTDTSVPLVLVRDSFPLPDGPEEIVLVLIDGWDRYYQERGEMWTMEAYIIEDLDLVQRLIVQK
jgi:hypothetical protein